MNDISYKRLDIEAIEREAARMRAEFIKQSFRNLRQGAVRLFSSEKAATGSAA